MLSRDSYSDQSISDGDVDEPDDVVSLDASTRATNKEELPLPVRLDFLKGISNQNLAGKGSTLPVEEPTVTPLEDEVEMPDFNEADVGNILGEVAANSSDEEVFSEHERNTVSTRELRKHGLRFVRHENVRDTNGKSEALLRSKESASCSCSPSRASFSKANRSGIWNKPKPRTSMTSLPHKYGCSGPSISNSDRLPEIIKATEPGASATLDANHLEDDDEVELNSDTEPVETEALAQGLNMPSMADLFDNLQDKTTSLYFPHIQSRGKTGRLLQKRSRSHLTEKIADGEDSPELVGSGSSSDAEVNDSHMKITFPERKMQSMTDRIQEALGTSSVIPAAHNSMRSGIFGSLQRVMQKEKERDLDFWKKLQTGAGPDSDLGCVAVKIISRYLDGKLTVCQCSFGKFTENFMLPDTSRGTCLGGRENTVIFNPRVCDNVDLEVGNVIRIHPPWKEIQVGNDNIILCTYFSPIS